MCAALGGEKRRALGDQRGIGGHLCGWVHGAGWSMADSTFHRELSSEEDERLWQEAEPAVRGLLRQNRDVWRGRYTEQELLDDIRNRLREVAAKEEILSVRALAARITSNRLVSIYREQRRIASLDDTALISRLGSVEGIESRLDLGAALAHLAQQHPTHARVLILRELHDLTQNEVAERLRLTRDKVRSCEKRAKKLLREWLISGIPQPEMQQNPRPANKQLPSPRKSVEGGSGPRRMRKRLSDGPSGNALPLLFLVVLAGVLAAALLLLPKAQERPPSGALAHKRPATQSGAGATRTAGDGAIPPAVLDTLSGASVTGPRAESLTAPGTTTLAPDAAATRSPASLRMDGWNSLTTATATGDAADDVTIVLVCEQETGNEDSQCRIVDVLNAPGLVWTGRVHAEAALLRLCAEIACRLRLTGTDPAAGPGPVAAQLQRAPAPQAAIPPHWQRAAPADNAFGEKGGEPDAQPPQDIGHVSAILIRLLTVLSVLMTPTTLGTMRALLRRRFGRQSPKPPTHADSAGASPQSRVLTAREAA